MESFKRLILFAKEQPNVSLILYNVYLLIATSFIVFLGLHSILYSDNSCTQFSQNSLSCTSIALGFELQLLIWGVVITLCKVCKQHTIKSHFNIRYYLAFAVIFFNFLIPVNIVILIYSHWMSAIITTVMCFTVFSLPILLVMQLSETCSPMNYTLLKTTKATNSQKLLMAFLFAITEAYYIGLGNIDLCSLPNIGVRFAFQHAIPVCPWINILAIPIVYRACLAYNSKELGFSGKEPISGRQWSGVCRWNVETEHWDYVEDPQKAVLSIS